MEVDVTFVLGIWHLDGKTFLVEKRRNLGLEPLVK
jgi:hypothetical protein